MGNFDVEETGGVAAEDGAALGIVEPRCAPDKMDFIRYEKIPSSLLSERENTKGGAKILDHDHAPSGILRASRARIVSAADAGRRRIERDLHDGAQQYLVALAVKARLVQRLLDQDAERARAVSGELAEDVEKAILETGGTISVFTRDRDGTLRHVYSAHPRMAEDIKERGIDLLTPVYNLLDLTPEGRGDWYAKLTY